MFGIPTIRLKIIRHSLHLTQKDMASFLGISKSTYYRWEKDFPNIRPNHRKFFRHIGINPQWVDYGDGEPFLIDMSVVQMNIIKELRRKNENQ